MTRQWPQNQRMNLWVTPCQGLAKQSSRTDWGEKSHSGELDTDTDSEFCVAIPQTKESDLKVDMLTLLAADIEQEHAVGPTVNEKLAEISKSRFHQKMPELKLKSKMDKYPVQENCPDKGYVDRGTKKRRKISEHANDAVCCKFVFAHENKFPL